MDYDWHYKLQHELNVNIPKVVDWMIAKSTSTRATFPDAETTHVLMIMLSSTVIVSSSSRVTLHICQKPICFIVYKISKKETKERKKKEIEEKNLVHLLLTAVEEKTTVNISFITIILNNIQIHFNLTGIIKIPKMSLMISCFTARLPLHCINVTGLLDMI